MTVDRLQGGVEYQRPLATGTLSALHARYLLCLHPAHLFSHCLLQLGQRNQAGLQVQPAEDPGLVL